MVDAAIITVYNSGVNVRGLTRNKIYIFDFICSKSIKKYPPEQILSHEFFFSNPKEFYLFYYDKILSVDATPSRTHFILSELEKAGKLRAIITQNIDNLHFLAGSENIYELHGSVMKNHCINCEKFFSLDYMKEKKPLPLCDCCGGIIKPDVVLYGEQLEQEVLCAAIEQIRQSELLIVGGTSLSVYPAAGLIDLRGGKLVIINRESTQADYKADLTISGHFIGDVFQKLIQK